MQIRMMPINARRDVASESVPARRIVAEIAPGPAIKRNREREGGNVADMILGNRNLRASFLALVAPLENHLEGDPEQSRPPAMRKAPSVMPKRARICAPATAKIVSTMNAMRLARRPTWLRSLRFMPRRKRQKQRCQTRWIDRHHEVTSALRRVSEYATILLFFSV